MLIDNPIAIVAACTGGAAAINLAMLKVSPMIKAGTRHLLAGAGPVIGALAGLIGSNDSVVAYGPDLAAIGAALAGGLAASIASTRLVRSKGLLPAR